MKIYRLVVRFALEVAVVTVQTAIGCSDDDIRAGRIARRVAYDIADRE